MPRILVRANLDEDLRPLSAALWQRRVAHRVIEDGGELQVELAPAADEKLAQQILSLWRSGGIELVESGAESSSPSARSGLLWATLKRIPVTGALIFLGFLGFALVNTGFSLRLVSFLTYEPFVLEQGRIVFVPSGAQYWRLVTPVFLHFGWLHITFNALWCWDIGRRIELSLGSINMLGLFLLTAISGNVAQNVVAGSSYFGGLSGVVYGLLGFALCAGRLNAEWRPLSPPTPVALVMLGWLVFCLSDVTQIVGFSVANAAHVGGLLSGCAAGIVFGLAYRK
ncbi:MAG: rhomboid family intramembrane serine protease [Pseudomonadota bacterium]